MNYFKIFDLKENFEISEDKLSKLYQDKITQFHPDKFASSDEKTQNQAVQNSSLINTAFDVLKSPLKRANYLLELNNIFAFDEKDTQMDADFLMGQIELREDLELIKNKKDELAIDDFIGKIKNLEEQDIKKITQNFQTKNLEKIKNLVRQLSFYQKLNLEANKILDELL